MSESQQIDERIRGLVSADDDSDWDDVLGRAGLIARVRPQTPLRPGARLPVRHGRRRLVGRRWLAPAVLLVLLVAAGAAIAAVGVLPWWQGGSPPIDAQAVVAVVRDNLPASVDTAHARTVVQSEGAALIAVRLDQTGYCVIPALDGSARLGAQCEYQVGNVKQGDNDVLQSVAQPSSRPGGPAWIVYGRITDPDAATLDLTQAAGVPLAIPLWRGFFLAKIPPDRWATLANQAGPAAILDAAGTTLRRGCVNWGPSPQSSDAGHNTTTFWSEKGNGPCTPQQPPPTLASADLTRAQKLVQLTLAARFGIYPRGTTIALWQAPGASTSTCVFDARADETPTLLGSSGKNPVGGGGCYTPDAKDTQQSDHPITVTLSAVREAERDYAQLLQGHVDPASGISRLELRGTQQTIRVAFTNGWFLAQLPNSHTVHLPTTGAPWLLTGYNRSGDKIATVNLTAMQATPQRG